MARPEATSECNECNEALAAVEAVRMARHLTLVAENALANGALASAHAALRDLLGTLSEVPSAGRSHSQAASGPRRDKTRPHGAAPGVGGKQRPPVGLVGST
jgi:hypothetical protein